MKIVLIALLFSVIFPLSFAHADPSPFAEAYAVGSQGSTVFQPEFTLNEQPYIYVQFYGGTPAASLINELTVSTWTSPTDVHFTPTITTTNSNQLWISLAPSQWNSVKAVGTWDTGEYAFNTTGTPQAFGEAASFKVNAAPEPVSTVLFLIGAFMLGINILRRKNAIAL